MLIKSSVFIVASAAVLVGIAAAQPESEPLAWRIMKWSDADQSSWINSTLAQGIPTDLGGVLGGLAVNKSGLTLPLIEKKIEDVLRSRSPLELFTDKSVDPQKFVSVTAHLVASAGNGEALRQISKLLAMDERRFDDLVRIALISAESNRNPFSVAYLGFKISDPAMDKRIVAWAESEFADKRFADKGKARTSHLQRLWAEAMIDNYGGVPSESQWRSDPLASHLQSSEAESFHDDMIRFASEAVEKRTKQ